MRSDERSSTIADTAALAQRPTQTDTHSQFWLQGEDVDQPSYTSFGSVQGIG